MKRIVFLVVMSLVCSSLWAEELPSKEASHPKKFGQFGLYVTGSRLSGVNALGVSVCALESSVVTLCGSGRNRLVVSDTKTTNPVVSDPNNGVYVTQDHSQHVSNTSFWGSVLVNPVRKGRIWPTVGVALGSLQTFTQDTYSNPTGLDKYVQVYGQLPHGVSPNGRTEATVSNQWFWGPTFGAKIALKRVTVAPSVLEIIPRGNSPKKMVFTFAVGFH
jgi:hypothetical protein